MTARNLLMDPITGELVLKNGNLQLVSDGASIEQAVGCWLRTFLGEWFLDSPSNPKFGIPYFQSVFKKNPNPDLLRKVFNDGILSVLGVAAVVNLDMKYTAATRSLTVAWRASTDSGQLISGQTGTP